MATANQNEANRNAEEARHNKQVESEQKRSNKEREKLERRGQNISVLRSFIPNTASLSSVIKGKGKRNDAAWYNENAQLVADAASLSYQTALGAQLPVTYDVDLNTSGSQSNLQALPGVCVLGTMHTIGTTNGGVQSVANIASQSIYTEIRKANSGARNYDVPDLMMYLLSADSLYSYHAWMRRIYGIMTTYNPHNWYTPYTLLKALNVDYDDFVANLADFRQYINTFAVRANTFAVPRGIFLYERHYWMYSTVFKDADVPKAGLYLYSPIALPTYSESSGVTSLELTYISGTTGGSVGDMARLAFNGGNSNAIGFGLKVKDVIDKGNALLQAMVANADVGTMSGDVRKAYDSLFELDFVSDNYTQDFVYEPEVLRQIRNVSVMFGSQASDFVIKQNASTGIISQGSDSAASENLTNVFHTKQSIAGVPTDFIPANSTKILTGTNNYYFLKDRLMDMHDLRDPKPIDNMVASRLTVPFSYFTISTGPTSGGPASTLSALGEYYQVGTEVVVDMCVPLYTGMSSSGIPQYVQSSLTSDIHNIFGDFVIQYGGNKGIGSYPMLAAALVLSHMPRCRVFCIDSNAQTAKLKCIIDTAKLDNYALVSQKTLADMHEVAIYSLFGVTSAGK